MLRVMSQFVGFCAKFLFKEATMELVMEPICVSKYWGYHVAKGTSVGAIKKDISCLSQVPFYIYNKCINGTSIFDKESTKDVQRWYTNLLSQLTSTAKAINKATTPSSLTKGVSLHEVWESLSQEVDEHLEGLKVRWCGGGDMGRDG